MRYYYKKNYPKTRFHHFDILNKGQVDFPQNKFFDFSVEVKLDEAEYVEYEIAIEKDTAFSNIPDNEVKFYSRTLPASAPRISADTADKVLC